MTKRSGRIRRSRPPMLVAFWAVGGASVLLLVAVIGYIALSDGGSSTGFAQVPEGYAYPVQAIERIDQRTHFDVGNTYDAYNSNPPTSGPHAGVAANWGISDIQIAKEVMVHNMEHGGAIVWYNCSAAPAMNTGECTQLTNELGQVVQSEGGAGNRVILNPYEGMENRIAITAWGFLDLLDAFDGQRIRTFIETFECNFDPEGFCR